MVEEKKKKRKAIEILAPAGSMEGVYAAIAAGADAIYIGGTRFGARAYANNLDLHDMYTAIDYVHLYGKRVYLTVNTLLKPREMEELFLYLKPYYKWGIDAVIVQDAGVMQFIGERFPSLPIHASTQMSLTMAEGAKCFERYPVTRLVNARELELEELKLLRENTSLEIESFVHGALCYCYSGQCLMSSMIGGRSGNRGRCAQPCRLPYDGKYLLSPKDICTLDMIPELIEAGIDSFKIEGRMKRFEYAAGVTAAYRREVDRYFELGEYKYREFHKNHPEVLKKAFTDMQDLYNRGGFSRGYYYTHNHRNMMAFARPNHSGVFIGNVEEVHENTALLSCTENLNAQDVLEIRKGENAFATGHKTQGKIKSKETDTPYSCLFFDEEEDEPEEEWQGGEKIYEFTLGGARTAGERFETKFTRGLPVKKGDLVYRTKNNSLLEQISGEYLKKEVKIPISGKFIAREGERAEFLVRRGTLEDENCIFVQITGDIVQPAINQPMDEKRLRAALEKTGNTPFYFSDLSVVISENIFIPVSALNAMRREILEALAKKILLRYRNMWWKEGCIKIREEEKEKKILRSAPSIHVSVMTKEQFEAALNAENVSRIYYDLAAFPTGEVLKAATRAKKAGKEFFCRMPRIFRSATYNLFLELKHILLDDLVDGYLLQNYEELYLFAKKWRVQEKGKILVTDAMLYTMNAPAKQFFRNLGVTEFTASYEENVQELSELGLCDMALIVYGKIPLMTSAQCIRKNTKGENNGYLIDRKQKKLPVKEFCRFCYNIIYSPDCLALMDCEEVKSLAPAALRYDFTFESGEEVCKILKENELPKTMEYTKGHFRAGVQ